MMKNMLIFGGSQFYREILVSNKYIISKKKTASALNMKFNVDNFSNETLTSRIALKYLDEFLKYRKYSYCIIALGEADIKSLIPINEFENNLNDIIYKLIESNTSVIVVDLPLKIAKKPNGIEYQNVIHRLAFKYNTICIHNGESNEYGNSVINDLEMKRTIYRLCL